MSKPTIAIRRRGKAASARGHQTTGQPPNWSRPGHAFRHLDGRACDWRTARPAFDHQKRPHTLRQRWLLWRAVRRERRAFRMAEAGHSILDSWYFLIPLGLMCLWALLVQTGVFK